MGKHPKSGPVKRQLFLIKNSRSFYQRPRLHGNFFEDKVPKGVTVLRQKGADETAFAPSLAKEVGTIGFSGYFLKVMKSGIETVLPLGTRMVALVLNDEGFVIRRFQETDVEEHKILNVLKLCSRKGLRVRITMFQDIVNFRLSVEFPFKRFSQ